MPYVNRQCVDQELISFYDLPSLEDHCTTCSGSGIIKEVSVSIAGKKTHKNITCHRCSGKGIYPSLFGNAILDFIRKYKDQL